MGEWEVERWWKGGSGGREGFKEKKMAGVAAEAKHDGGGRCGTKVQGSADDDGGV